MLGNGEAKKEAIRPDFNKYIFIDFAGTKITSDAGIDQKKGLQRFDRRAMAEKHGKRGSGGLEGGVGCILGGPGLISSSEQRKTGQKTEEKVCGGSF